MLQALVSEHSKSKMLNSQWGIFAHSESSSQLLPFIVLQLSNNKAYTTASQFCTLWIKKMIFKYAISKKNTNIAGRKNMDLKQ